VSVPPAAGLQHHDAGCFGCGPDAAGGLHVVPSRVGDRIHATHAFSARHAGMPGIAHGGLVATLVDDVSGFLLQVLDVPAVTRTLELEYLTPVLIGVPYDLVAEVDRREGRKVFFCCEGRDPDGHLAFRGRGLFVVVDPAHFARAARAGEPPPVAL
jgi:acyl-coenzyme A thioesterase PaaI-like protein